MDMSGSQRIEASRERVWEALNDPAVLRQCIPGCESIDKVSPTEMNAKAVLKIGPVKASFTGKVTLSDLDPPNGYTITGEGQGGVAGFAKGGAKVRLEADGEATILHYEAKADVGGKIAQLGARLIDGTAKKLAGDFFDRVLHVRPLNREMDDLDAARAEGGEVDARAARGQHDSLPSGSGRLSRRRLHPPVRRAGRWRHRAPADDRQVERRRG